MLRRLILLSALCFILLSATTRCPAETTKEPDPTGGIRCLHAAVLSLGGESDVAKLTRICDKNGWANTLTGLGLAAEKMHFRALETKIKADELSDIRIPGIAQTWDGGFVLVEGDGSAKLKVTVPAEGTRSMSPSEFSTLYAGFILFIAEDEGLFPKLQTASPNIKCEWYTSDFGYVNQGDKVLKTVKVYNVGDEPLTISNARGTCGCTPIVVSEKTIAPKSQGEIKITFDMSARQGVQRHKVYIQSNDPVTPIVQLQLTGIVIPPALAMYPRGIDFGALRKGEAPNREINIYDSGGPDFKVSDVIPGSSMIKCALTSVGDKDHPRFKLSVGLSPDIPLGEFKSDLTIKSNHPKEPVAVVPITAVVRETLATNPVESKGTGNTPVIPAIMQVVFGDVKKNQESRQTIKISSLHDSPFKIEKVDIPFKYVTVEIDPKQESKEYTITIIMGKDAPLGSTIGNVILHTTEPNRSQINLQVYARVSG